MLRISILCIVFGFTFALNSYIVTIPNAVIPGIPLNFHVTILQASADVHLVASLKYAVNGSEIVRQTGVAQKGNSRNLQLNIPEYLIHSAYKVSITGSGGVNFHNESDIYFKDNLLIFFQTDKSRYSAGQEVQFRVVMLKQNLIGYTGAFDVEMLDGKANKLQRWRPQNTSDGVFKGAFGIGDEPVFGNWKIIATVKNKTKVHEFEVNPYILPRFSVSIDMPNSVLYTETKIDVLVTAMYTFKKPVIGKTELLIYVKDNTRQNVKYSKQITGQVNFTVPMRDLKQNDMFRRSDIKVRAIVTDNATALTMATETDLNIHFDNSEFVQITRQDARNYYVPGLPYVSSFVLTIEDRPMTRGVVVQVYIVSTSGRVLDCFTTHSKWIDLTNTTLNSTTISLNTGGIGRIYVNVPAESLQMHISVAVLGEYRGQLDYTLKRVLPEDNSNMLRVTTAVNPIMVGETIRVYLHATHRLTGIVMFEVYSSSMLVHMENISIHDSDHTSIQLTALHKMVPSVYVVAYFVGGNGLVLSDEILITVKGLLFSNNVSVHFNATHLKVKDTVALTVLADPGSKVYLMTEDEKNRLLGTDNDIFLNQVDDMVTLNKRASYSANIQNYPSRFGHKKRTPMEYHSFRRDIDRYGDTDDAFIESGLLFLSDSKTFEKSRIGVDLMYMYRHDCPAPAPGVPFNPTMQPVLVPGVIPTVQPGSVDTFLNLADIVRSRFPETFIWEELTISALGSTTIVKTVPDSITTWVTSAFATNGATGFGIAENKTEITVFKDFFVTVATPQSVILGEKFLLQVTVFNYMKTQQTVFLQISHSDDASKISQATTVPAGKGHSVYIPMTPSKTGALKIDVLAKAGDIFVVNAIDSITKTVLVKPAGIHRQTNVQQLLDVATNTFSKAVNLLDPPNMVPGTKSVKLSITGDFMLPSVEGLENLLAMPYGCGEQTMLRFAPNIYIRKYLEIAGKMTNSIQSSSKRLMEAGLQRELTFKRGDGSYSAFGDRDNSGSTWLTAFVLKCFHQAKGFLYIDVDIFERSMSWLLLQQRSDGRFNEPGRVIHTQMQSGTSSGVKITAFILISVLENRDLNITRSSWISHSIQRSKAYLERQLSHVSDTYTLSLVCYALSMAGSQQNSCYNTLTQAAHQQDGTLHWTAGTTVRVGKRFSTKRVVHGSTRAPSRDIEATAYALLFYLSMGKGSEAFPIVKWLVSQRNPTGGFSSTQDTVISLQAISEYASTIARHTATAYGLNFNASGTSFHHTYTLNSTNKDIRHELQLPSSLSSINIQAQGHGSALIDITTSYYVTAVPRSNIISVTSSLTHESLNSVTVHSCARWNGTSASGMIIMEVEMPTGFIADSEIFKTQSQIKRHETNGRNVFLYFDGLSVNGVVCANVKSERSDPVVGNEACHVSVYDYYEPLNHAMTTYESGKLKSATICDVCPECNFCKQHQFSIIG